LVGNFKNVSKETFKIVRYDQVPFGARFRYKNQWMHASLENKYIAEYNNGYKYIKLKLKHNPFVGIDPFFRV